MKPVFSFREKICFNSVFIPSDRTPSNLTERAEFCVARASQWVLLEPRIRTQLEFWNRLGPETRNIRRNCPSPQSCTRLSFSVSWCACQIMSKSNSSCRFPIVQGEVRLSLGSQLQFHIRQGNCSLACTWSIWSKQMYLAECTFVREGESLGSRKAVQAGITNIFGLCLLDTRKNKLLGDGNFQPHPPTSGQGKVVLGVRGGGAD